MGDNEQILQELVDFLVEEMRRQIRVAGHVMTGELLDSVEGRIKTNVRGAVVQILINEYGLALDQGVSPENIPYSPGSGARSSKYIAGLQRFAMLKLGATQQESLSIAFAIARTHKMKGMPVAGASEFIQATIDGSEAEIQEIAERWAETTLEIKLENIIKKVA